MARASESGGGPRRLVTRLGVLVAATVVALGAAEVVVRVAFPAPEPLAPYHIRVFHEGAWHTLDADSHGLLMAPSTDPVLAGLHGVFHPNLHFKLCYDARDEWARAQFDADGCVDVRINSEHLRGPLRPREKPADVFRIALVGDSFTFGHGVRYEDTWGARVEEALGGGDVAVEVLNFAVSGYDADEVALMLRHRALQWQPDRLLYGFFLNDLLVADDAEDPRDRVHDSVNENAEHDAVFGAPRGLAKHSLLWDLVRRRLAQRRVHDLTTGIYGRAGTPGTPHFEGWRAALADMAAAASEAGVPLDVVVFPEIIQLDDSHELLDVYAAVTAAAEELGLGTVSIFEAWQGLEARDLWVHATDHHPNDEAHAWAAMRVEDHLRKAEPRLR